jgi:hypothetical protein
MDVISKRQLPEYCRVIGSHMNMHVTAVPSLDGHIDPATQFQIDLMALPFLHFESVVHRKVFFSTFGMDDYFSRGHFNSEPAVTTETLITSVYSACRRSTGPE